MLYHMTPITSFVILITQCSLLPCNTLHTPWTCIINSLFETPYCSANSSISIWILLFLFLILCFDFKITLRMNFVIGGMYNTQSSLQRGQKWVRRGYCSTDSEKNPPARLLTWRRERWMLLKRSLWANCRRSLYSCVLKMTDIHYSFPLLLQITRVLQVPSRPNELFRFKTTVHF